jgi:hypothetical protein
MTKDEKERLIFGATEAMQRAQEEARKRSVEMGTSFIVADGDDSLPYKASGVKTAVVNEPKPDEG